MKGLELSQPNRAGVTFLVAASNASPESKARADRVCNGTADEVDINWAIAALPAGGGKVELSEGSFNIEASITDQGLSNVMLVGQGNSSVLYLPDNAIDSGAFTMVELTTVNSWTLCDFKIDGNKANNTPDDASHSIDLSNVDDSRISRLSIVDSPAIGLRLTATSSRNVITGCFIDNSQDMAVYFVQDGTNDNILSDSWLGNNDEDHTVRVRYGPNNTLIRDCVIYNGLGGGVLIEGSAGNISQGNSVLGCYIDSGDTTPDSRTIIGIQVTGGAFTPNVSIVGNIITQSRYGININCGMGTVEGNTIYECDVGILVSAAGILINGNNIDTIEGTGGDGRGIDINTNDCVITDNIVQTCSTHGIDAAGLRTVITGNAVINNTSRGITESGSANYSVIVNNNVDGNATNIFTVGAATRVSQNASWVTENSGTGSITSGGTTDVIAHGLDVTPTVADIIITLAEDPTNTPGAIWVDTIGAANFTVNCENDPGASNLDFGWRAVVL